MILSIDPGTKATGWALWQEPNTLIAFGIWKGDILEAARETSKLSMVESATLVIEIPMVYHQSKMKGKPDQIIKLAFFAGQIAEAVGCRKIVTIKPYQWKGQTPKDVTKARILQKIKEGKIICKNSPKEKEKHDVFDAIGIGAKFLKIG